MPKALDCCERHSSYRIAPTAIDRRAKSGGSRRTPRACGDHAKHLLLNAESLELLGESQLFDFKTDRLQMQASRGV